MPSPDASPDAVSSGSGTCPDPLIQRALRLLAGWPRVARAKPTRPAAGDLAGRLVAEELPVYAWLDIGLWGRPVYQAAAQAALRLQAVAVAGDDAEAGAP